MSKILRSLKGAYSRLRRDRKLLLEALEMYRAGQELVKVMRTENRPGGRVYDACQNFENKTRDVGRALEVLLIWGRG